MKLLRAPQATVFDMDGLLLDTERLQQEAYTVARAEMGLAPDPRLFMDLIGLDEPTGNALLRAALPVDFDHATFTTLWSEQFAARIAQDVPLKPGVRSLLDALERKSMPLAVATSTRREKALWLLEKAAILDRFDVLVCGDEVGRGKPAPDIYLAATAGLGTQPERCFAFEDSANGVRAAVAAGLFTVQVPDLVAPTAELVGLGHLIAPDLMSGARLAGLL